MPGETSTVSASIARPSMVQRARPPVWIISMLRDFPSSSISIFKVFAQIAVPLGTAWSSYGFRFLRLRFASLLFAACFQFPARLGWGDDRFRVRRILPMRHIPERGGNCCRIFFERASPGSCDDRPKRLGEKIVEPTSVYFAGLEIGGRENPLKKLCVCFYSVGIKLRERSSKPHDGFRAIFSIGD